MLALGMKEHETYKATGLVFLQYYYTEQFCLFVSVFIETCRVGTVPVTTTHIYQVQAMQMQAQSVVLNSFNNCLKILSHIQTRFGMFLIL